MIKLSTGFRKALCVSSPIVPLMNGGTILVYGGTIPNSPDNPPATDLLGQVTTDGLTFTPNEVPTPSGLQVVWASPGFVIKNSHWILRGVANGTATWFRWCWRNEDSQEESQYFPRLDGTVGDVLRMGNKSITTSRVSVIEAFILYFSIGS
jgi:hypothetical protein